MDTSLVLASRTLRLLYLFTQLYAKFTAVLVSLSAIKSSHEHLLTALDAVLRAGGSLSIRQEARHGEDLLPAVLHGFQGAAG